MAKFYAVKHGRKTGVFTTWAECKAQIDGFSGAIYKAFPSEEDAKQYIGVNVSDDEQSPLFTAEHTTTETAQQTQKSTDYADYLIDDSVCIAYVDGSNTSERIGSGAVLIIGSSTDHPDFLAHRNVSGEINSAVLAILSAHRLGKRKLVIMHDYLGIRCWANGEWKPKIDMAKRYKAMYDKYSQDMEIEFVHVKGHTGNAGNEMVDRVAKKMSGVF